MDDRVASLGTDPCMKLNKAVLACCPATCFYIALHLTSAVQNITCTCMCYCFILLVVSQDTESNSNWAGLFQSWLARFKAIPMALKWFKLPQSVHKMYIYITVVKRKYHTYSFSPDVSVHLESL